MLLITSFLQTYCCKVYKHIECLLNHVLIMSPCMQSFVLCFLSQIMSLNTHTHTHTHTESWEHWLIFLPITVYISYSGCIFSAKIWDTWFSQDDYTYGYTGHNISFPENLRHMLSICIEYMASFMSIY